MTSNRIIQWGVAIGAACIVANAHAAGVHAEQCWIRAMPAAVPSAGYFVVVNDSDAPHTLTDVSTPAFGMAMMHRTESNGSTSTMVGVDSVPVPAHGSISFAPKGYHVMLEQPAHALKIGSTLPLTLSFDDGSKVTANCAIKSPATLGQPKQ